MIVRDNGGKFDIYLKHRKGIGVKCIGMGIFGLLRWVSGKESACQSRRCRKCWFDPWVGTSPGEVPVFLPENTMDRGAWQATVLGVTKSWTRLNDWAWKYLRYIR